MSGGVLNQLDEGIYFDSPEHVTFHPMLTQATILGFSLILLYLGAEWLVRGAAQIAAHLGVRPLIVGLVVVGFGTSMPEVVVSGLASLRGHSETALGNVIGSNIANSGLILAIATLIRPMRVDSGLLRREGPFMVVVTIAFWALAATGSYSRLLGMLSLAVLAVFVWFTVRWTATGHNKLEAEFKEFERAEGISPNRPLLAQVGLVLLGIGVLVGGGQLLVNSAVAIARHFGVSELVIALTLISIGTSVPELATSIVAAVRRQGDISIGNVIGSNTFNLLGVLGLSATIRPIDISPHVLRFEMVWMTVFAILTLVFLRSGRRLARWEGGTLLLCYFMFLVLATIR